MSHAPQLEKILKFALQLGFLSEEQAITLQDKNLGPGLARHLIKNQYLTVTQLQLIIRHAKTRKIINNGETLVGAQTVVKEEQRQQKHQEITGMMTVVNPEQVQAKHQEITGMMTVVNPEQVQAKHQEITGKSKLDSQAVTGDMTITPNLDHNSKAITGAMTIVNKDQAQAQNNVITNEDTVVTPGQGKAITARTTMIGGNDRALPHDSLPMPVVPGQIYGNFEILEELGRGGMGVVYKAKELDSKKIVAMKLILGEAGKSQIRRFLREARATARLKHRNIIAIHSINEKKTCPFFTMEFVEGYTYEDLLKDPSIPLESKLEKLAAIADALYYAHNKNILHRDIKPSNILIAKDGRPLLTDFGLAKMLDSNSCLTQSGQLLGTPFYMSPEQAQGKRKQIGPLSDIYSLGIMLYQTLTGRLPFIAETLGELQKKIVDEQPVPPQKYNAKIPLQLQAVCIKAIEKVPSLRYGDARELSEDIKRFCQGQKVHADKLSMSSIVIRRYHSVVTSPWKLITLALAVAIPVAFITYYSFFFLKNAEWQAAQNAYLQGQYHQALKKIARLKNFRDTRSVEQLQEKIYQSLLKRARQKFQDGKYDDALKDLSIIARPDRSATRMKAQIFQKLEKFQEMRLELVRLNDLSPNESDLKFMADAAFDQGYLTDAIYYYRKIWKKSPETSIAKKLAHSLLLTGNYQKAQIIYQDLEKKNTDGEIAVALAILLHRRHQYKKALDKLSGLNIQNLSRYWQAQALLVESLARWATIGELINSYNWLFESSDKHGLSQILQEMEQKLQKARTIVQKDATKQNYLSHSLLIQLDLHWLAIGLEHRKNDETRLQELIKSLQAEELPSSSRLQIYQVIVRYLTRKKEWQKCLKHCNAALLEFPWNAELYHMRALTHFHRRNLPRAITDIDNAMMLNNWNFIPFHNVYKLILPRMTPEEFNELAIIMMNRLILKAPDQGSQLIFKIYQDKARQKILVQKHKSKKITLSKEKIQNLSEKMIQAKSGTVANMTASILTDHYQDKNLIEVLHRFQQKYREKNQQKKLKRLEKSIRERREKDALDKLERLLLRYAVLQKEIYAINLLRKGEEAENRLVRMVKDPSRFPIIRLLAARMLISLKTPSAYDKLKILSEKDTFPNNLLAITALREFGDSINLPQFSKKLLFRESTDSFYCLLIALQIDPRVSPDLALALLNHGDNMVSLGAAYHLRKYGERLPTAISLSAIEQRLLELCRSTDVKARIIGCRIFWDFRQFATSKKRHPKALYEIQKEYRKRCWKKYHEEIVKSLRDSIPEVQFAAIRCLVWDSYKIKGDNWEFRSPEIGDTPSAQNAGKILSAFCRNSSSYCMKFWSTAMLGTIVGKELPLTMMQDRTTPLFVRLASTHGLMLSDGDSLIKSAAEILKMLRAPATHAVDVDYKQLLIISLAWNIATDFYEIDNPMIKNNIKAVVQDLLRKKKLHTNIKRAGISALTWGGNSRDLKLLKKTIQGKSKNIHLRRAAATSAASIIARRQPHNIKSFTRAMTKYPKSIKEAAAYGYYEALRFKIKHLPSMHTTMSLEKQYDIYIKNMIKTIGKWSKPTFKTWIQALQSAGELDPQSRYFYELSVVAFQSGEKDLAKSTAVKALELVEKEEKQQEIPYQQARCLLLLARYQLSWNNDSQAAEYLKQLLALYPFSPDAHFLLAQIYHKERQLNKTSFHYKFAYHISPDSFPELRKIETTLTSESKK